MKWESKKMYEHPISHRQGMYGKIEQYQSGIYVLRVGAMMMGCPQGWASQMQNQEMREKAQN